MLNPFASNINNVTDPSQWKHTRLPDLSQLDSLQRCVICKEFLRAPVMTTCNHAFCSECIRQYLMKHSKCPLCQTQQLESNLSRVVVLEEIVNCFSSLRPFLLEFLLDNTPESSLTSEGSSPKRKRDQSTEPSSDDIMVISELEVPSKKPKFDEAECPICQKRMDPQFLQSTHIDNCLKGRSSVVPKPRSTKQGIASFFTSKPKSNANANDTLKINHEQFYFSSTPQQRPKESRLPKLDFSSLSLPKLKEKLTSLGLPTTGTRHQLELRYNQYYILYNSNLDSSHPVDVRILRLRLNKWEASHLAFNGHSSDLFSGKTNSISSRSISDKKFLSTEWKRVYHQEFKQLEQQAKRNASTKRGSKLDKVAQESKQASESSESSDAEKDPDLPLESSLLFISEKD